MKLEATRRILDQQFQFGRSPQTFPKKIFLLTGIMHFIQHAFFFLFLFPLTLLCKLKKAYIYIYTNGISIICKSLLITFFRDLFGIFFI